MLRKLILVLSALLLLVILLGCTDRGDDYELTTIALPRGDAHAGRDGFVSLGCADCHRVEQDRDLPVPVSGTPGPELGKRSHTASWLATSITAPSHQISPGYRETMCDYTDTMTVRQLADLVAYLRGQAPEPEAASRTAWMPP